MVNIAHIYIYTYLWWWLGDGLWFMALFYPHYSQMTWNHTEFCPETWVHWDEVKQIRFRKLVHVFSFTMWNTSYHPEVMVPNFFGDAPKSPHAKQVIRAFHPAILRIWSWDVFQCHPTMGLTKPYQTFWWCVVGDNYLIQRNISKCWRNWYVVI